MSAPDPGWYDDPAQPGRVRYWDGRQWTEHVAEGPDASGVSEPRQDHGAAGQGSGPSWGASPQAGPPPWDGGGPGPTSAPAAARRVARASDGARLAAWWRRLVAYFIDNLICSVASALLLVPLLFTRAEETTRWRDSVVSALLAGQPTPVAPPEVASLLAIVGLAGGLVYFAYETVGLVRFGTTLGRRVARIRVRSRAARGGLTLEMVSRRSAVKVAGLLVSGTPGIGVAGEFIVLIDIGRGLFDRNRRTVHDLAGGTEVVLDERSRTTGLPR
ncbi:MAG: RDD family protein [Dermatophilaceae bacterium]